MTSSSGTVWSRTLRTQRSMVSSASYAATMKLTVGCSTGLILERAVDRPPEPGEAAVPGPRQHLVRMVDQRRRRRVIRGAECLGRRRPEQREQGLDPVVLARPSGEHPDRGAEEDREQGRVERVGDHCLGVPDGPEETLDAVEPRGPG